MRVAHIIVGLEVGGAEQMLKRLLLAQPESTDETLVISLTTIGPIGQVLRAEGIRVETAEMRGAFTIPLVVIRVTRLLQAFRPEIVQTWMYHADLLGGIAARMAGIGNVVWGIRNSRVPRESAGQQVRSRIAAWLSYILPRRIVCVADAARASHIVAGFAAGKMRVVANGFDFEEFDCALAEAPTVPEADGPWAPTIGCVGRYHHDKGQDVLITAAAEILKHYPDIRFVLVGRGCSPDNEELVELLNRQSIAYSFTLLGERDDVPACLTAMDIFCMPSRTEGFPNALIEAMAMNRTCVATDSGDTGKLAGENVIIVAPGDEAALAQGLLQAIAMSPKERLQYGMRAGVEVRRRFSMAMVLDRYQALYREILEERR